MRCSIMLTCKRVSLFGRTRARLPFAIRVSIWPASRSFSTCAKRWARGKPKSGNLSPAARNARPIPEERNGLIPVVNASGGEVVDCFRTNWSLTGLGKLGVNWFVEPYTLSRLRSRHSTLDGILLCGCAVARIPRKGEIGSRH